MKTHLRKLPNQVGMLSLLTGVDMEQLKSALYSKWANVPFLIWCFLFLFPVIVGVSIYLSRLHFAHWKCGKLEVDTSACKGSKRLRRRTNSKKKRRNKTVKQISKKIRTNIKSSRMAD